MNDDKEELLYFAYGSNMAPQWLQAGVPSARPLQRAALPGHTLELEIYRGPAPLASSHDPDPRAV
ncbi:MAG: gamma-glutamylcyclotransferase family protein [Pseudomonadota bacterium]